MTAWKFLTLAPGWLVLCAAAFYGFAHSVVYWSGDLAVQRTGFGDPAAWEVSHLLLTLPVYIILAIGGCSWCSRLYDRVRDWAYR